MASPAPKSNTTQHRAINAVGSRHILVNGDINNTKVNIFVDSGSSVSLVSHAFIKRMKLESKIEKNAMILSSFTNDRIPTYGSINLPLLIGNLQTNHNYIITDHMDTELLIGIDFLKDYKITLNMNNSTLQTQYGECKFFRKPKDINKTMRIKCSNTTTIPPITIQYLKGKIPNTHNNYQGLTEPYFNTINDTGLLIAHATVYTNKRTLPLQCINATDIPITITKGRTLGLLHPIELGKSVHNVHISEEIPAHKPYDHRQPTDPEQGPWTKQELFKRLNLDKLQTKLSQSEMDALKDLLWTYKSTFSHNNKDLGCCNMYEAKLELKPNYQP